MYTVPEEIPEDVIAHTVGFLDGISRSNLCCVSQFFHKNYNHILCYDGPHSTRANIVIRLKHAYWDLGIKTDNHHYYTTVEICKLPIDIWVTKVLMTESIHASKFLCLWHYVNYVQYDINYRVNYVNDLLRDAVATISSESDHQTRKIQIILETFTPSPLTQNYILRMSCIFGNEDMVRYLIDERKFAINSAVIMSVLISEEFTYSRRLRVIEYLLKKSNNVRDLLTEMNYWNLKYPLYNQDWDTFVIMYRLLIEHYPQDSQSHWTDMERTICYGLPESVQLQQRADIEQYRLSLLSRESLNTSIQHV